MNDLAGMYPRDKRLNFLIGYWLYKQDEYERSKSFTLKALADDPDYATAYNQLGYLYSRSGDYSNALDAMSKYVKLLPSEPNPHDSYGEMLRLSGRFQEALDQYRIALKIDPTFYISQKELGETYAVMGDGERAREEYAKAIHDAPSAGLKAEYMQKAAMTYLRDKKFAEADKAYRQAGDNARALEQWVWEARAHRIIAMYQPDQATALKELDRAEELLEAKSDVVAKSDLDEEHARILRVGVERAVLAGDQSRAGKLLANLGSMAISGSVSIQRTYSGAAGTVLVAEKKYREAIPVLEEDFMNPLSIRLLVTAYRKTHATAQAEALRKRLLDWKIPTIEEALAVPAFRAQEGMLSAK
jgi:Flp pilus assembly protein TadD